MPREADWAFDYRPTGVRDPNPSDLDGPAAVRHGLARRRREPVTHKVEQFGRELRKEQRIAAAALSRIGKHFQCPASSMAHCADHTEC
jgi:hypothetical protein